MSNIALYLAGGGARGAYQAGVLKAIGEICPAQKMPFSTISGVSVGSINAAIIAQNTMDFSRGTLILENLWRNISSSDVFNASNYQLSKSILRHVGQVIVRNNRFTNLLDTTPLQNFIKKHINFDAIEEIIRNNKLQALEVISNCYETQQTVSFYQHSSPNFEDWSYPRHISVHTKIHIEHILASSALPLFFPTVAINHLHYGDGSMGLISPLRGSLRFDVEKICILGTRLMHNSKPKSIIETHDIGFAQVLGNMLNGLFLDNLDRDIETVNRMNEIARLLSLWKKRKSPWRPVQTLHLRPSVNIGEIAQSQYKSMPTLLRFLLNSLGAQKQSGDLLSFLLFEPGFTNRLIDLGYQDTIAYADIIADFLEF